MYFLRPASKLAELVPTAKSWCTAHSRGATARRALLLRRAVSMRSKCGELLFQVGCSALRALQLVRVIRAAHQLFEFGPTVFTTVFKDRHDSSVGSVLQDCCSQFINGGPDFGGRVRVVVHQNSEGDPGIVVEARIA